MILALIIFSICFFTTHKQVSVFSEEKQVTPWGIKKLHLQESENRGQNIKIAVLDSGINGSHEDLSGKVVNSYNALSPGKAISDESGHGTAIGGIIAANDNEIGTVGVAPDAEIYDVKVLDSMNKSNTKAVIRGIEWAINEEVDLMNMSFGLQNDIPELSNAINKAIDAGIIVVAASGNTMGLSVDYPAKYENVLSISAVNKNFQRSNMSAKGKIDYAAPGVDIYSTTSDGSYDTFSGTSFAAAYFTGILALILSDNENSKNEIRKLLKPYICDLGEKDFDPDYGEGLIILN
ncbi:S8 family peptidase [Rossellomorea aquimaris]|uniref:S8 family peptidase n=1 Tax=Rossellomorea aquimaris TaxID=189382 RepID=UPI000ADE7E3A|nr:S8 family peptidase [Rossellomorea aquimaris]